MSAPTSSRWANQVVRKRAWIAGAWIVACALLLPMARQIESILSVAAEIEGSQSAEVERLLQKRFASPFAHYLQLVISGIPSPAESAGNEALLHIVEPLKQDPSVTRVISFLDGGEPLFHGTDRKDGPFVVVGLVDNDRPDILLQPLRRVTEELMIKLRPRYPNLTLQWTGSIALNADLRVASAADAQDAERRALPVLLLLLVLAFGALVAAVIPIVAGLVAIGITLGLAAVLANVWSLSILLQNVVTMIGLGLGIDYSLLIVSRFREELAAGRSKIEAAEQALRHAGPTIILSGAAVAIGFAALALMPVNELRSVAIAGLLIVTVSVLLSTTLLPGVLAWLGRGVDLGRVPLARRGNAPRWSRWANVVAANPVRVLLFFGLPVCVLALHARHLRIELPRGDWLPQTMESAQAIRSLDTMGRSSVIQTIRVILQLPANVTAISDVGWTATQHLSRLLAADPAVQSVRSLPHLLAPYTDIMARDQVLQQTPEDVQRTFVSRDAASALLEVVPRERSTPAELRALVDRIRKLDVTTPAMQGCQLVVGGLPAFNNDYESAVAGRFFQVIALVVVMTFLALAIGFRSVLIPLKAIVLNLLAVAGAFGAVVLVFQQGFGSALLGLQEPLDGIFPAIPVLVFCIVFGLSMDYEVFLVARVREARRAGLPERAAIANGLVHTGGLITSAAAIMIVVFGAFTLGDFLLIKMLGFALAVAVFLDATVMRLAVSPALLALAGRWNWWPGDRVERGGAR